MRFEIADKARCVRHVVAGLAFAAAVLAAGAAVAGDPIPGIDISVVQISGMTFVIPQGPPGRITGKIEYKRAGAPAKK